MPRRVVGFPGAGSQCGAAPWLLACQPSYTVGVTARQSLHQIVDELPEPEAARVLRAVEHWRDDPVALALASAPFDDAPETPEERAAVEQARDEVRRGDVTSAEEVWGER